MCQVQIISVNGIVPLGSINPTQLKVTGYLTNCLSGQVVVSSSITAPSPPTAPVYLGGGFVVLLNITPANVACDTQVNVHAECYQTPGCYDNYAGPLKCCDVVISLFDAVVTPGSLTPSQIRVTGTLKGCISDQVIVGPVYNTLSGLPVTGPSLPKPVDPVTGSFIVQLPITAAVQCDDNLTVTAECYTNPGCKSTPKSGRLDCPQCARALVSIVNAGPCTGSPPKQPITLGATINIAKGTMGYFKWNYGDGSPLGPLFEIDNTGGTATTAHIVPPYTPLQLPHDYSPGTYVAELIVTNAQGSPLECDRIPLQVVATCNQCPDVIVSANQPGPCINGKRKVTLITNVNSLPAATAFQWLFGDSQQGLAKSVTATGSWPTPPDPLVNEHEYLPGTYTAQLVNIVSPNCSMGIVTVTFTVNPCPNICCPTVVLDSPQVTGCAPSSAVATFNAQLSWQAGCTQVAPTSFEWTLNGPGGKKYQKSTTLPSTDTTAGWKDTGGNPMVVQFSAGGNYSVSMTAIIPGVSLPCNPTDTIAFTVSACCPQLIGPLNASEKPGDPCTWIFSAQVSNPNSAAVTYEWTFQDGATAATSLPQVEHTYAVGSITTGSTTLTLKSPNCPDQSLSVIVTHTCLPPTGGGGTGPGGGGTGPGGGSGSGCLCGALLVIALLFFLLSITAWIAFGCSLPVPNFALLAGAIVFLLIAVVAFILWAILCANINDCGFLNTLECLLRWLIAIWWLIALIVGAIGGPLCGFGAALAYIDLAVFLLVVNEVQKWIPCPPTRSCFGIKPKA